MRTFVAMIALLSLAPPAPEADGELRFADLGSCPLESGQVITGCRIGYRAFGALNAARSNAVLVPAAFAGTSADVRGSVGADRMLDPAEHYIIAVDPLGNGISSSPSNSRDQPGQKFPAFTIRDMVETQRRLVVGELRLSSLRAVVGTSMGGMQAFQWIVSYPELVERAVPIVASPQLSTYDLLLWETMLRGIEATEGCADCDPVSVYAPLALLVLQTPERFARTTPREKFDELLRATREAFRSGYRPQDVKSQLRALMAHDVGRGFGGSLAGAAARLAEGRMLIVVATRDHVVRPEPALAFARLARAEVIQLSGDCGHGAAACEAPLVRPRVRNFLSSVR